MQVCGLSRNKCLADFLFWFLFHKTQRFYWHWQAKFIDILIFSNKGTNYFAFFLTWPVYKSLMDWRERRAPSSSGLFKILWEGYIEVGGIDSFLYWKEKNVIVSRVAPLSTGDEMLSHHSHSGGQICSHGPTWHFRISRIYIISIVINWYYSEKLCNSECGASVLQISRWQDEIQWKCKQNVGKNFRYILFSGLK